MLIMGTEGLNLCICSFGVCVPAYICVCAHVSLFKEGYTVNNYFEKANINSKYKFTANRSILPVSPSRLEAGLI